MIDIRAVARILGGDIRGKSISFPTPGHSAADRGSVVTIDPTAPQGMLVHSFNGGDAVAIKQHVLASLGLAGVTSSFAASPPPKRNYQDRALTIWAEARPPQNTLVETYLASRKLYLPQATLDADVIRFHPACPFRRDVYPAMIAVMRSVLTDEACAIHRTALRIDGKGKASMLDGGNAKRMLGPAKQAVIKLIADAEVSTGLGIAEGIENALTALCRGWTPVWAAGSEGAVAGLPILPGVEALTIFADPDPIGQAAARQCAMRWQEAGSEATIITPPGDVDWNEWSAKA